MAGARRTRLSGLLIVLFVLVILYVTTAKQSTYSSKFYTRTVAAIKERQTAEARADILASEKARQERVARLQDEHNVAMGKVETIVDTTKETRPVGISSPDEGQKPVTGRKTTKDGKVVIDETKHEPDGVAKVGNVQAKPPVEGEKTQTEEEVKAEAEINAILKKGPIIIFSKSYCPYSKKAKHILLDFYTISPTPVVVELDTHPLGPALQSTLGKMTGRKTVPNVLVNGKSIGGGDDIEKLHTEGKLTETLKSLGGKRVTDVNLVETGAESKGQVDTLAEPKRPVRLRA